MVHLVDHLDGTCVALGGWPEHHGTVTQPAPELEPQSDEATSPQFANDEDYEDWRDLQDILEERNAEWWAEHETTDDENLDSHT